MHRVLRVGADDAGQFASVLRDQDPSWRSEAFALSGGRVALWGAGLYVNRAFAVGLDEPMSEADFDLIEARSSAVGVDSAIDITDATVPAVRALAAARGYTARFRVAALRRRLDDVEDSVPTAAREELIVEPAGGQLGAWQETAAIGWGHSATDARRASDAFAAAAAEIDGRGFLIARDAGTRVAVGCATVNVRGAIATLRGMSTVPGERGRGVQGALIRRRLSIARAAGCTVATTTAEPGGTSERNLLRHGFEPWFTVTTFTRPRRPSAG